MSSAQAGLIGSIISGVFVGVPALLGAWWSKKKQERQLEAQTAQIAAQTEHLKLQIRAQLLEQRRELRSQHYAEFVSAVDVLLDYLEDHWVAGLPEDPQAGDAVLATTNEHKRTINRLWSRVAVEGPRSVADAGVEVLHKVGDISKSIRSDLRCLRAQPREAVTARSDKRALANELGDERDEFIAQARKALQDNGTRRTQGQQRSDPGPRLPVRWHHTYEVARDRDLQLRLAVGADVPVGAVDGEDDVFPVVPVQDEDRVHRGAVRVAERSPPGWINEMTSNNGQSDEQSCCPRRGVIPAIEPCIGRSHTVRRSRDRRHLTHRDRDRGRRPPAPAGAGPSTR